ncbi:hypothetical protein SUGI_1038690 [Cryptomeria japonica]|uniref:peroxisome biogenesis protein 3-2 isoform X2 n=1 Tax=Cryptomeria japonica TaxID=3369 RepID=UPI002414AF29|nr:peroxisome biogenesis protein 3-2 isoform X2 [Cryptomeria japonica]GLJ49204.1 hypothetical protein SUGI_1038690 [Cryptomeria japonica]
MNSIRAFINRHRRKLFFTAGILGTGYALYRVYFAQKERMLALEREEEAQCQADELVENRLREHFENLQNISDSASLAFGLENLDIRLSEELDYTELTERLSQGRGHLSSEEKLQLWERLKILSFTRTACALWAMTVLNLYIKAQLNILGRHIFIEQARGFENVESMDQSVALCQHKFIESADYLHQYGVSGLIIQMQEVVENLLKSKDLRERFTFAELSDTFTRILEAFSSRLVHWINYVIPENGILNEELSASSSMFGVSQLPRAVLSPFQSERAKLEQLMAETHSVLSSDDFGVILELALKAVLDNMMKEFYTIFEGNTSGGIPLAKILPPVARVSSVLLEHPIKNRFINIIGNLPQVQSFYALVYANVGAMS